MKSRAIVAATDFSDASLLAVETALDLVLDTDGSLYLLHVIDMPATYGPMIGPISESYEALKKSSMERLEDLIPENRSKSILIEKVVQWGSPASTIAEFAADRGADMIVVGTHGRTGLSRMLMGSTAESLLRQAPCQVLVVKPKVVRAEPKSVAEPELHR